MLFGMLSLAAGMAGFFRPIFAMLVCSHGSLPGILIGVVFGLVLGTASCVGLWKGIGWAFPQIARWESRLPEFIMGLLGLLLIVAAFAWIGATVWLGDYITKLCLLVS